MQRLSEILGRELNQNRYKSMGGSYFYLNQRKTNVGYQTLC